MPEQSNDYQPRWLVFLVAGGVGKSSLVLRFVRGPFRDNYVPTIEDTYRQVISSNTHGYAQLPFSFLASRFNINLQIQIGNFSKSIEVKE